jgi:hypothetical protein
MREGSKSGAAPAARMDFKKERRWREVGSMLLARRILFLRTTQI